MTDQPPQGPQPEQPPQAPPTGPNQAGYQAQPPKKGMGTGPKIAIGCAILFVLALLGGCAALVFVGKDAVDEVNQNRSESSVSLSQYNQIQDGQTLAQVETIMGGPGVESSTTDAGGSKIVVYTWTGDALISSAVVTFTDDKVSAKTQFGLE